MFRSCHPDRQVVLGSTGWTTKASPRGSEPSPTCWSASPRSGSVSTLSRW